MPGNLHSLDGLLQSVRDPESKRLAHESVTAYQAGAYRASILSIWVAVCADIISKLKELATGGDAGALLQIQNLNGWIKTKDLKNLQQFENSLLEVARDGFEMLLAHEAGDLLRLRDDRNLCAHPAFVSDEVLFSPTPEIARAHIAHAILHLLSRPPVQGKQLIARFDRDLKGGSFPVKSDEIEIVLRQNYLARAKAGSIVSLTKALAKALVGTESPNYKGKEQEIANSLAAIGRIIPGPFEENVPGIFERLGREVEDGKVLALCRYVEPDSRIWDWLGEGGRARVLAKIDNALLADLGGAMRARHVPVVGERLLARLKKEDPAVLEKTFEKYPCRAFVGEALSHYSQAGSFATAAERGKKMLLPHASFLVAADIQRLDAIIRTNKFDQILQSSETATILNQVFDQTLSLLLNASIHWSAIAEYVVVRKVAGDYAYPQFLEALKNAGVKVPEPTI